jgi:hypothetical protein
MIELELMLKDLQKLIDKEKSLKGRYYLQEAKKNLEDYDRMKDKN